MFLLEDRVIKFNCRNHGNVVPIKAVPGHFATVHSHINYYIDLTTMKARASEAKQAAHALAQMYIHNTVVDTIVCLDDTDVIGAFLAEELGESGRLLSMNEHGTIYVIKPEYTQAAVGKEKSQLFFRENILPMIRGRHVVILMASVTTGESIRKGIECIDYYGGKVVGVSALFSRVEKAAGIDINYLFNANDIPNYESYNRKDCPFCKRGIPVEALVNSFGYSKVK